MLLWCLGLSFFAMFSVLTFNASRYFIKHLRHSGRVWHLFGTSFNGSETLWVISSIYVDLKFHVYINSSSIIYTPRSVWLSTGWLLGQLEGIWSCPWEFLVVITGETTSGSWWVEAKELLNNLYEPQQTLITHQMPTVRAWWPLWTLSHSSVFQTSPSPFKFIFTCVKLNIG